MLIGYARASAEDQFRGIEAQIAALQTEGCEKLFRERVSSVTQREQLEVALASAREGDTFVVTTMDRLARSSRHLLEIVEGLDRKGVALRLLDFEGHRVDTHSRQGKLLLTMFTAFAQFEREAILERQQEGNAKAGGEGRRKGRKPTAKPSRFVHRYSGRIAAGRPRIADEIAALHLVDRPMRRCLLAKGRTSGLRTSAALASDEAPC